MAKKKQIPLEETLSFMEEIEKLKNKEKLE